MSEYIAPDSLNIVFGFSGDEYDAPNSLNIVFNFGEQQGGGTSYIAPYSIDSYVSGQLRIQGERVSLYPLGNYSTAFGYLEIKNNARLLQPSGLASPELPKTHNFILYDKNVKPLGIASGLSFGKSTVFNFHQSIHPLGIVAPTIDNQGLHNLDQYLTLLNYGINSAKIGTIYVIGGVKEVKVNSFYSQSFATPKVINTRADQFISVVGKSISAPSIVGPMVSPRTVSAKGFTIASFGIPFFQRNPSPKGFINSLYGLPWVSEGTRSLIVKGSDFYEQSFPKIYDPTIRLYLVERGIGGGIFGDIRAINKNIFIYPRGFDGLDTAGWHKFESNKRSILIEGLKSLQLGQQIIFNKSPSVAPGSIDQLVFDVPRIEYFNRTIKATGLSSIQFGPLSISKPPELKPYTFATSSYGKATVNNFRRFLEIVGISSLNIGNVKLWFRVRENVLEGFNASAYGNAARVEHGRRYVEGKGFNNAFTGNPWLSFKVRSIQSHSIESIVLPNPKMVVSRYIGAKGFSATQFGSRIIPEIQTIYLLGMGGSIGTPVIYLQTQMLYPRSFLSVGQQAQERWGTAKLWNLTQYINHYFDNQSGLNPPTWPQWTKIENKNKTIAAFGVLASKYGEAFVENSARLITPNGFDSNITRKPFMVSYWIRKLFIESMEAPYISGWGNLSNTAFVIAPLGFKGQEIGLASAQNTRRYYQRVGNFDSAVLSKPMVSFRVRTVDVGERYSIAAPRINLQEVKLYSRYIEVTGIESYKSSNTGVTIHWNILAPKWIVRDEYGYPYIKNLTPEVLERGHNSEEFGNAFLRLEWRPVNGLGNDMQLHGKTEIAFRDRKITVIAFNANKFDGKIKVTKTGAPPFSLQYIWLNGMMDIEDEESENGNGIKPLDFPYPKLNQNVLYASGFVSGKYGSALVQSNTIIVQSGINDHNVGTPSTGLKNREIRVLGILLDTIPSRPAVSPHTIYAVMDAPNQARNNHPQQNLHYVDSDFGTRAPGSVVAIPRINHYHRKISNVGNVLITNIGSGHTVISKRNVISPSSINGFRMGWHEIPGDKTISIYDPSSTMIFGQHEVIKKPELHRKLSLSGIAPSGLGTQWVSLLNRTITAHSFLSMAMGTRLPGDTAYMWQGLRVGPVVPVMPKSIDHALYGKQTISLMVRDIRAIGFDAMISEHDVYNFKERMRVIGVEIPRPPISSQLIETYGFESSLYGVTDIKPGVHYIRPDGNSDQYRKGAF